MKIQQSIEKKLTSELSPLLLLVENESHMHNVPLNSQTHFKLTLVTDWFLGKRKVARHQFVYKVLADELAGEVHALAMHLYTAQEWIDAGNEVPKSPQCLGGSKAEE